MCEFRALFKMTKVDEVHRLQVYTVASIITFNYVCAGIADT